MTTLRFVTGKGGVGKSSVAAAVALAESRRGRRVLLAEVNGGDRIAHLAGLEPTGGDMREVLERIHLVDMNPRDSIREYVLLTFKFETVYSAVFENRLVKHFLRLVPSLGELVMLGKLWHHHQETGSDGRPRFDVIVVDAPATGHAISMLRAPSVIMRTVPAGPLRDNAQAIDEMLRTRSVLHVVTTPEEMPVNEARELERAMVDLVGMQIGTTFINQNVKPLPGAALEELETAPGTDLHAVVDSLRVREQKRREGEAHLQRLPNSMLENAIRLPRLVSPHFDRAALALLSAQLDTNAHFFEGGGRA